MNQPETGIARRYLEATRYQRRAMAERSLSYPRAPLYKEYPDAAQRISLDPGTVPEKADLWQCLAKRQWRPLPRLKLVWKKTQKA